MLSPQIQGSFSPEIFFTFGLDDSSGDLNVTHHTEKDALDNDIPRSWCEYHRVGNIVNLCYALDFTLTFTYLNGNPFASCVLNAGGFPDNIRPGRFIDVGGGVMAHDETTYGTGIGSVFMSPGIGTVLPNFNADIGEIVTVVAPTINAIRWQGFISDGSTEAAILLKASHLSSGSRYYLRGNATYYTNAPTS